MRPIYIILDFCFEFDKRFYDNKQLYDWGSVLHNSAQPRVAEIAEPKRTPNFASPSNAKPSLPRLTYERSAINIDTVKPIPHTTQTLANDFHEVSAGNDTTPNFTAIQEKENTPKNLPTTKPNMTARLTPDNTLPKLIAERSMPALAKANSGITM